MSRPYPLLPKWPAGRCLPWLACAALSLRATSSAQPQTPAAAPDMPVSGLSTTVVETPIPGPLPEESLERGFLGVTFVDLRPEVRAQTALKEGEGLMIYRVASGSPADRGGVCPYDILLRFNDQLVISEKQVATLVENAGPGCEVELTLLHRGREKRTRLSLCRSPKPEERAKIHSLPLAPSPEDMLTSMLHTFHENPAALEWVWRIFHGPISGTPDNVPAQTTQRYTLWDEGGQVELIQNGNFQRLRAWDAEGHLVYDGPCQTPQQRAEIPDEALARLEALEKRRRMQLTPSVSPYRPGAAAPPVPRLEAPAATAPPPAPGAAPLPQREDSSPASK
ncbi:MAG: PDZ domain-containing protein [Verrucomicrobiaceae bacterium]|nr:MAG: PDZ domain-containing protein [Verrucomicrobiaceae bacterium]